MAYQPRGAWFCRSAFFRPQRFDLNLRLGTPRITASVDVDSFAAVEMDGNRTDEAAI
jgi:hypothetical protein